ncbi:SpoIID/LytB domain-containing protein [Anaerobacillus alkalilacustris]|uniref:SpoIID/LytB domain-containing protein n=1 Tax=Anaerobacillus alkalilacustris TaxID=393763 RepID=UPI0014712303|nr:SpoIID/LytB domain-containing protein [Anaerobacillus alkalilacustris]
MQTEISEPIELKDSEDPMVRDRVMNHGTHFQSDRLLPREGIFIQNVNQNISIRLINYLGNVREVFVTFIGEYNVEGVPNLAPNRTYRLTIENGHVALYEGANKLREGPTLTFIPKQNNEIHQIRINNRPYIGNMQFTIENSFLRPINTLPVEEYLKGVVPHEMPASWAIEALKVQAIAARTYAMSHGNRIIDDSINFQVYAGLSTHPNSTRAVIETTGQVLQHKDRLALTVYSSSNGGITESNANIWGGASLPYLLVKEDPYDPVHPWSFQFKKVQIDLSDKDIYQPGSWWQNTREVDETISNNIKSWLGRNGYPNSEIKIYQIPHLAFREERTSGERVIRGDLSIQFFVRAGNSYVLNEDGSLRVHTLELKNTTAQLIRSIIGINLIRTFLVDKVTDEGLSNIVSGRGFGHGVGMSQWGAKRMADNGSGYRDILQFYYPGTALVTLQTNEPTNLVPEIPIEIVLVINSSQATVNGKSIQLLEAPFIRNDRTLVPLRFVSEQLGADVSWDSSTLDITITTSNKKLILRGGSRTVSVNARNTTIDVAPEIIRGTTFVPLRFVSEQIGAQVKWHENTRSIVITN